MFDNVSGRYLQILLPATNPEDRFDVHNVLDTMHRELHVVRGQLDITF